MPKKPNARQATSIVIPNAASYTQKKEQPAIQATGTPGLKERLAPYLPGIALFFAALIIALFTYKDYGVSWDEPYRSTRGLLSFNYIFNGNPELLKSAADNHGTSYELLLVILQKMLHLTDSRDVYLMRHLVTHIFFLVSAFFGYVLILRLFKNRFLASLGFIMLAFAPRLYAHSFFNSKDIPFTAMILITLTLCQVAFEKNKPTFFFLLGLACGYATSIRIMGVMLAVFILSFLLIDLITDITKKESPKKQGLNMLVFSVGFFILLYLGWPYLWESPVHHLAGSFNKLAHYDVWNGSVLFHGKYIKATHLPWTYIPTWFLLTNPEVWLVAGIAGFIWILVSFFKNSWAYLRNTRERNFLLYVACFVAPVMAVIMLHSVVYNGWRHLYFVYPAFVLMAIYFADKMMQTRYKKIVQGAFAMQLVLVGWFMVQYHPFHQVYFNNLASHSPGSLRSNYDMDYWGCSYIEGLEYLLDKDQSKTIKVSSDYTDLLNNNILLLPEEGRRRIQITDKNDADYFFTNFIDHPYDYPPYKTEYEASVLNSTIFCIFRAEHNPDKLKYIQQEGINNLRRSLAVEPGNFLELKELGHLYFSLQQYDSAQLWLGKALALEPNDADAIDRMAGVLKAQGRYPEAIALLKKLHGLEPNDDVALMLVGSAYFASAQYDSCEVYSKQALALNPKNRDAMNNLAGVYFFRKDYPAAIATYRTAIALYPEFADPYTNTGVCYLQLGRYDSAVYYSNKALTLDPSAAAPHQVISAAQQAGAKPGVGKRTAAAVPQKQLLIAKRLAAN